MKITYYGHGCIGIQTGGKNLLIDPFISGNPLAKSIDIDSIPADYILITHGHTDHVLDVEQIAKQNGAQLISNFEIISWFEQKGLKGHPMNHGGKVTFDSITIKYVNAIHSSVLPDGTYGGNPGGFVIWTNDKAIYVAGDTALTKDMELIPLTCPPLTAAVLPIGDNFTMGYEDACLAAKFIQCETIIGCHYNTFPPIQIDTIKATSHFYQNERNLLLPEIGETIEI